MVIFYRLSRYLFWLAVSGLALGLTACSKDGSLSSEVKVEQPRNVLLIVADDLGYADIQSYGGEISTPNIDSIAAQGVTFNRFYTSTTCSPTRAMLLTGADNHLVGLGNMFETLADSQLGQPGYEGHLNKRFPTIAEILRDAGYHTYMAGKWHLGLQYDQSAAARGFERELTLLYGGASHYEDMIGPDMYHPKALYRKNGELIKDGLGDEFYSTKNYTEFLIDSIEEHRTDGRPFFGYLAYTAPHWPLQAPQENIDKFKGQFDMGWEAIRPERFLRAKQLGVIPDSAQLPDLPDDIQSWDELNNADKARMARYMEVYAAMIDYLDAEIGRLITYLKDNNLYENTLIVFMSDNGSDALRVPVVVNHANTFDNSIEAAGSRGSFVLYEPTWASASSGYLHRFKGTAFEGGMRVPAFMSVASMNNTGGRRLNGMATVQDVLPTILDFTGVAYPELHDEANRLLTGRSLLPLLDSDMDSVRQPGDSFAVEMWGQKAILENKWKLVEFKDANNQKAWALYDVFADPGETQDLAQQQPEIKQGLLAKWSDYIERNDIILYDGPIVVRPGEPLPER